MRPKLGAVGERGQGHGAESGGACTTAIWPGVQLGQELGHVVGVGDAFPGVAGRIDAGGTSERIDLQAGVVRHRGDAGGDDQRPCLEAGVVEERLAVLDDVGNLRRTGHELHLECVLEDGGDFSHLVGIGRGQDDPQR